MKFFSKKEPRLVIFYQPHITLVKSLKAAFPEAQIVPIRGEMPNESSYQIYQLVGGVWERVL